MDGVDPAAPGATRLPSLNEHYDVINAKTTNWCVVPWATGALGAARASGARARRGAREALGGARLRPSSRRRRPAGGVARARAAAARRRREARRTPVRRAPLRRAGHRPDGRPSTDVAVRRRRRRARRRSTGSTTSRTSRPKRSSRRPDPGTRRRASSRRRSRSTSAAPSSRVCASASRTGRAVAIDADENAEALRARCAKDENASRLGEVALVDREGRIGQDRNDLLQHAARRERGQPSRVRERVRDRGRRRGPRPHQPQQHPHRLHVRLATTSPSRGSRRAATGCRCCAAASWQLP